jgi:hypothetical protein
MFLINDVTEKFFLFFLTRRKIAPACATNNPTYSLENYNLHCPETYRCPLLYR